MKTSPDNRMLTEGYLNGSLKPEEQLLLEARAITDEEFARLLEATGHTRRLVRSYGRKHLRRELQAIHNQVMAPSPANSFYQRIRALFN